MTLDCAREHEVVQAVLARRLDPVDDVGLHAAACPVCQQAMTLAAAFQEDCGADLRDVHVPAAGQVWWRAAIRARLDATQAAARPLTWAHGVAAACAAGLAGGAVTMGWPTLGRFGAALLDWIGPIGPNAMAATDLAATMLQRTVPFGLAAACLLLAPIAIYVVFVGRDN